MCADVPLIRVGAVTFSISRVTGGLGYAVRKLHQALLPFNAATDVLTLEGGWGEQLSKSEMEIWHPLRLRVFPCWPPHKLGYSPHLLPGLRECSPQLIHCHGLWRYHCVATSRYGRAQGIPVVVSPHGMLDPWAMRTAAWKKRLGGWLYHDSLLREAACLSALCESEAKAIREYGLHNPICIAPNGVDLPANLPSNQAPCYADALARGRRILLFLGRIDPKKGLVNLIKAWQRALKLDARMAKSWVLVIAGSDRIGHGTELKKLTQALDLADDVLFLGPQYDASKDSLLRRADAFILPSFSEGLPVALLEAWAYSLPVLMTAECNIPEGFTGGAGLCVEPKAESIAQGLAQLFEMSDGERQMMGARGLSLVKERFAWPKVAAQMRAVYEWLLGGGPAPDCVRLD